MAKTVAHVILEELTGLGTDVVFGVPGGLISPVFDALLDRPDIRLVTAVHETTAAFMAMGYCHATGKPGLLLTTGGPGLINALTGIGAAAADGLPVILVAGEVPTTTFGRGALHEGSASAVDAVGMARRLAKSSAQVSLASSARSVARKALSTAISGRKGPAVLTLPLDIGRSPAHSMVVHGRVSSRFEVDEEACRRAVAALTRAERPVMLLGNGSRDPFCRRAVRALAERLSVPVMVTTKGKGVFPEEHPLYLGVFGLGGHDNTTDYLTSGQPDVVMIGGTSLNDISTNAWSPLLQASKTQIHVDIDAIQIGRNYRTDIGIVGPLDTAASRMLEYAEPVSRQKFFTPLREASATVVPGSRGLLSGQQAIAVVAQACPNDTVFVSDIGEFLTAAVNTIKVREGGDFVICFGLASMGSGIGAAIGYQIAEPTRRVIAVCGDGGFLMYGNELVTAVKHRAPLTLCILNDRRFNMCHHGHLEVYGRTPDLTTAPVDFSALAKAMGADGRRARTAQEIAAAVAAPLNGPRVIDIEFDSDARLSNNPRNAALKQFSGDCQ